MKELSVVYVGPAMSGRRTSLAAVVRRLGGTAEALTVDAHAGERFSLGGREFRARISSERSGHFYDDVSRSDLTGGIGLELDWLVSADGIVFLLDSQDARQPANDDELLKLRRDLSQRSVDLDRRPVVFQANKRDLSNIVSSDTLRAHFRTGVSTYVESVACRGDGTVEAIAALLDLIG